MRDVIWTIIFIWLAWRIYEIVKQASKKNNNNYHNYTQQKEGEVKINPPANQKSRFNPNDAEYVDYEEIK